MRATVCNRLCGAIPSAEFIHRMHQQVHPRWKITEVRATVCNRLCSAIASPTVLLNFLNVVEMRRSAIGSATPLLNLPAP